MLLSQPRPRLSIRRFPEENTEMQKVSEFVALIDVNVDSLLFAKPALFVLDVWIYCANKLSVTALGAVFAAGSVSKLIRQICNAAVQENLNMSGQLGELLNHEILLAHKLLKTRVVNSSEI